MSFRSEFGKFVGNGLRSINQNPLTNSIFSGSPFSGTPAPIINDWSLWNSSGDMPFSSLGVASNVGLSVTISTAKIDIDATRFLLISGGYLNPYSETYIPATVIVGTRTAGKPTFGTPVNLDEDINGTTGTFFRSAQVSDGKVYIYYSWYNGTAQVTYAKICNVAVDGTITFGTRSAQIGLSTDTNAAVPHGLTLDSDAIHAYHLYRESGTNNLFLVATTINGDDTITVGTTKDTGLQSNVGNISTFLSGEIFFTNGDTAYVAPSIGATIGNIAATLPIDISIGGCAVARLNDSKMMVVYVNFGSNYDFKAVIVTYDRIGFSLSKGTAIQFDTIDGGTFAGMFEALSINNSAQQVMATYFINPGDQLISGVRAICLTPSGTTISAATPYQINCNLLNFDYFTVNVPQSVVMSETAIISPYCSYDNVSFGATILNLENAFEFPTLLYRCQASEGLTSTPVSPANGSGTIGSTSLTISGDLTATFVPGILFYENTDPSKLHLVTSSSVLAGVTTVNFSTPLYATLINIPLTLIQIQNWQASSGFFNTLNFIASGDAIYLGELNGQPTLISASASPSAALTSDFIASGDASAAASVMGVDFTLFIVTNVSDKQLFDSSNDSGVYPCLSVFSNSGIGYTDIFPTFSTPVEMNYGQIGSLNVFCVVRKSGDSRVYSNLNELASSSAEILAAGSAQSHCLFNFIFGGGNAAVDAVSDIQFWAGSLNDDQRIAVIEALQAQYLIT